ncbi:MAG TPA: acetylxylan esterase [Bryobacteraceae bacterium]|jgi:cephalosporin-C deacetylase-like acetyl esterase|nr:acetylxylan esterase [Bryobacteraceae bacterium]
MVDNYLSGVARKQWERRDSLIAAIKTPQQVNARQEYIRATLHREVGEFPAKTPLRAQITGTLDRGGYTVEKLVYESMPHFYVTANVYVPKAGRAPHAAVVGVAGHSGDGKAYGQYQSVWISLARRGIIVLAIDPPGQGERSEYLDASGKPALGSSGTGEHMMAGLQCLLTGTNIARYFIWDAMRGVDYLLTRPDVDPSRIGAAGNSGGGTQSTYLAAFDPRIAAAAPSCYITSWQTLWPASGPQDSEQVLANFLRDGLDFPDFLIAFAPKPIQIGTATQDFFPIAGARATYAQAQRIFALLGAGDHAGYFEFDDQHGWSQPRREAAYRWFTRWLQSQEDDRREETLTLDSPADLHATKTGQVQTSYPGAQTVQSLNAALAASLETRRGRAGSRSLARLLRTDLALPSGPVQPSTRKLSEVSRGALKIEELEIHPEDEITVPALAFVPPGGEERKRAVLYLNQDGKAADAAEGGAIEQLAAQGAIVLAIDPRGWGESAPAAAGSGGHKDAYQLAMRGILTGKPLPGMQTYDVLNALSYLASRPDVDRRRISIQTKGTAAAILGIYAGVLEPRVARVVSDTTPDSFLAICRMKTHGDIAGMIVPGILRDLDLPDLIHLLGTRFRAIP